MEWRTKVELFEQIRREYEFGVGTIAGVAKKLNIHRRMVREAIGSALPVPRKKAERPRWKLAAAIAFVDQILEADKKAPRKQRHTAHRIWERIQREMPQVQLCERTVRGYVHERKLALGLTSSGDVRSPELRLGCGSTSGLVRCLRRPGRRADQVAGLLHAQHGKRRGVPLCLSACDAAGVSGGHERAFAYFTGVFRRLRYDNLGFGSEEDSARATARRDGAVHRLPFPLAIRE